MLANKRVLVTGAGGFIGSHVCQAALDAGARVRAFVRYTSRPGAGDLDDLPPALRDNLELVRGDLRDPDAVTRAVEGMDIVLHLGAVVPIPYSYHNPLDVTQTNVMGTAHLLTACLRHHTPRVVVASTSEVYGSAQRVPMDESHPLHPQSPYAASKVGADALAASMYHAHQLPVVILRPFNTFGPRQSARAVIPTIMAQALFTQGPLRLGALDPRRDFTYVEDTAAGFLCAATAPGVEGETIQLGTGVDVSVGELVERIGALMGRVLDVHEDAQRLRPAGSEVDRLLADPAKALLRLEWQTRVDLTAGLQRTLDWVREHPERYRPREYTL